MNELSLADMVGGLPPQEPQRRSRRSSERRRKKRRRRTWVLVLVALIVVGLGVGAVWIGLRQIIADFNKPTDYPGPGAGRVEVVIPDGASGTAIGQVLQKKDVVLTVKGFAAAFSANRDSGSIQPGTYALRTRMRSADAVAALLDDANRLLLKATLKEGIRISQVPEVVSAKTKIPVADLKAALKNPAAIGLPPEAKGDPEGWIFPATYDVQPHTTAAALLRQMVAKTIQELDAAGVPAAQRRAVLIKASMVQAEAKLPQDFPKIARVFENRLAKKMKLQLDTTVHYATGNYKVATTIKDTQINSPYNTYLVPALPVGPIGNPGAQALQAVLHPAPGKWLYFVAVNPQTGLTKYAETPAQFTVIKREYDLWAKAHPGQ